MDTLQKILNNWCLDNDIKKESIGKIVWDDAHNNTLTDEQRIFARSLMNVWQFADDHNIN